VPEDHIDIEIIAFREEFAIDFARLNYEWIAKAYSIEDHDRDLLDHPIEKIIDLGGEIFFALAGELIVGTVALIPLDGKTLELAKMAVSPECRGRGIGEKLMEACIVHAGTQGRRSIILESNTKQVAAVRLYRKFGFKEIRLDPNSYFERANIRMELVVS